MQHVQRKPRIKRIRDVHVSNPTFPVNVFINILRNKGSLPVASSDNIHERNSAAEADNASHVEDSAKSAPVKLHRLSRTRKLKYGSVKAEQHNNIIKEAKSHHQPVQASDVHHREPFSEDALWTDTYCPRHSSEVIGNTAAIEELHRWLNKWKKKSDVEDKKISTEKQNKSHSNDLWDCGDFEGEAGSDSEAEEQLHNTILISGPPGVGKTAAVYACALELGFKVFEVNCSSQRSGRDMLAQLKEATQSHQLETSATDPLKPAFYNSYNRSYGKSEKLPDRIAKSQKKAPISICKKKPVQTRSSCRNRVKRITLTNYFKTKAKADYLYSSGAPPSKKLQKSAGPETHNSPNGKTKQDMMMSLILFEEVDVIFEDDVGFLTAVKTFMTTTKRPVVLMTSDPLFREKFNSDLVEIIFETPSRADVCSYLQLVCLAQKVRLDSEDANTLFSATGGDVRRALLQLQFWANSGAGGLQIDDGESTYKGCSANMLGLQSITKNHLFQFLQLTLSTKQQMAELHQAVVESWRNGFPILYSNLEFLLHIDSMDCLTALSDFLDAMSFIDATFPAAQHPCNLEDFVWTGAKVQDGLLDKLREEEEEEDEDQEMKLDMRATLEALGVHRCGRKAALQVQKSRQGHAENLRYVSPNRHVVSHRFDLYKKVLSSQYFGLLHNTRAAGQDYLPVIRYICRIHRKQKTLRCINTFRTPLGLTKEMVRLLAGEFSEDQTKMENDATSIS
uniref:AAA+ ATPase domain-containing protein n=1 Tax=Knipowitschia caucasica TaxID=637954 RepID=A0AAV2LN00_KNICA